MGSTQVVVVAEKFVVLQRQRECICLIPDTFTKTDSQYGSDFNRSGGGRRLEREKKSPVSSCMTVLFGSDNTSGYRPIEQQLVWQVALVRNVCLFSKWSST